ncbi:hypothetical protein ACFE04_025934 [Oxalis oulophora]
MGPHGAIEVAKTVIEVADVAWSAIEVSHHHHQHNHDHDRDDHKGTDCKKEHDLELESLRAENQRLRNLLEQNLRLLQNLSDSPCLINDCPPDLYARLAATVDSENFMNKLKDLQQQTIQGTNNQFPFKEATGTDMQSAEMLINVDQAEPSWWVWVSDDMVPSNIEEQSEIDDENYIVISEEHVVDGVAYFMAKCILSNPKGQKMTPEDLQKSEFSLRLFFIPPSNGDALAKALGGVNKAQKMVHLWHAGKMFYTLGSWGLALAGLYRTRAVLRIAAVGLHATTKVALRAL